MEDRKTICSLSGQRSEALKRANARVRELESMGCDVDTKMFGNLISASWTEVKKEAEACTPMPMTEAMKAKLSEFGVK